MIRSAGKFTFPILAAALAGYAFIPQPAHFAATFAGWLATGTLLVVALIATAALADGVAALFALAFVVPVLTGAHGLPGAFGLPFLFIALLIAARAPLPESKGSARGVAALLIGWMIFAFVLWFRKDLTAQESTWGYVHWMSPDWPEITTRPLVSLPFGNPNPISGFAVMLLPLFVAFTVAEAKEKLWRTPWAIGTTLAAALLLCGSSRPAQIAPFAAAFLYLLLIPGERLRGKTKAWLAGGAILAATAFCLANPSVRGLLTGTADRSYSDSIRRDYLDAGIRLFREHPWTGVGPGGVPVHYSAHTGDFSDQPGCHQLHSTPVQWLAEYGAAGGLLWLALAALSVVALIAAARARENRALRAGAAVAAFAYLLYSLFDYQLHLPATAFLWGSCLGLALRGVSFPVRSELKPAIRTTGRIALALLPVLALITLISGYKSRGAAASAATAIAENRPLAALDALGRAMEADPASAVYPTLAATLITSLPTDSAESAAKNRAKADALFEAARNNAPDFPYLAALHGMALADAEPARALAILKDALRVSPKLPDAWTALARAYVAQNKPDAAVTALALRGMIMPEDLFSPELREGRFAGAAKAVNARFRLLGGEYAAAYPEDTGGSARLKQVMRQIDAWEKAGENVEIFLRQNPEWSSSPTWRHLRDSLDTTPGDDGKPALRSRMLMSAATKLHFDFTINDGEASMLTEQCAGRGPNFSGVRTLRSREAFGAFGLYFGDTDIPAPFSIHTGETDMLPLLFVYENNPVRPHLNAGFFKRRLEKLP